MFHEACATRKQSGWKNIKPVVYQKTISSITKEKTKTDVHFRIAQLEVLDPQYYLPL